MKLKVTGRRGVLAGLFIGFGMLGGAPEGAVAQPANDLCSNAEPLLLDFFTGGSNELATSDLQGSSCAGFDDADVWYAFSAPQEGRYRFEILFDFNSTLIAATISAFDACGGVEIACDADGAAPRIDLDLAEMQTVLIRVAGALQEQGTFSLLATVAPPPPVNDECDGAIPLTLDELWADAFVEPTMSSGGCFGGWPDLWYVFTAPDADRYRFTVTGGGLGMNLAVFSDCALLELACDADCSGIGRGEADLGAGESVRIRVGACTTVPEPLVFYVVADRAHPQPANDHCADAQVVTPGTSVLGTSRGATDLDEPDIGCPFLSNLDLLGVWYSVTNPSPEPRVFHLTATPLGDDFFTPNIRVLDGCNGSGLSCGGDGTGPGQTSSLNVTLGGGQTAVIRIAGDNYSEGDFELSVSQPLEAAPNDECAGALALAAPSMVVSTTANATESFLLSPHCTDEDTQDLWYSLSNTTGSDQIYSIDTVGTSGMDFVSLVVYDVCDGTILDCNVTDDELFPAAKVEFVVAAGQSVLVRIAGTQFGVGDFVLNVSAPEPPPPPPGNDDCSTATVINSFPYSDTVAAGAAGPDIDIDCNDDDFTSGGVWYSFTAPATGVVWVQRTEFLPELTFGLFEGGCGVLTPVACDASFEATFLPVQAGVEYQLLVGRQRSAEASPRDVYDLTISFLEQPGWGDACADAVALSLPVRALVNIETAQNEGIADAPAGSCNGPDTLTAGMNHSAYFSIVPSEDGVLTGSFYPVFFEGMLVVYEGACGVLTEVHCMQGLGEFAVNVQAGRQYIVQLGSYDLFWFGSNVALSMEVQPPSCAADLDGNGTVDVFDLLAYLDLWFAGDAGAELTGDDPASIDVFDLLVYLDGWFAGC